MSDETDTVTLTRAEYEALIERIEDAEDNAFLDSVEARERVIGKEKARADYLPAELVRRLIDREHPVRVWRIHRGLGHDAFADAAGIAPSYLTERDRNPPQAWQLRRARQARRGAAHLAR
jgi:ribosome-binding ATPase YchF (GTP1/OBG family)